MAFDKSNPAWQADTHFARLERQHDMAVESLVKFLIELGADREEALAIIAEADETIRNNKELE